MKLLNSIKMLNNHIVTPPPTSSTNNSLRKGRALALLLTISVALLTACGGGGGSTASMPTTPTTPPTPPAKPAPVMTTVPTPVAPTTVAPRPTGSANAPAPVATPRTAIETIVQTATGTNDPYYRLTCVPGSAGEGCYTDSNNNLANVLQDNVSVYNQGVTAFHRRIEGPIPGDPSIYVPTPPRDVRSAWREGWTGLGANILIMDDFRAFGLVADPMEIDDPRGIHGYTVGMATNQIAPGATFYGLEAGLAESDPRFPRLTTYRQGGLRLANTGTNVEITGTYPTIHVVNMSFGEGPVDFSITADELEADFAIRTNNPRFQDVAGIPGTPLSRALADAVITKAAGNNGVDSAFVIGNVRLLSTRAPNTTRNRTLIVGALDKFARASITGENSSVSARARMASYSNIAGIYPQMQARFLVEYGGSPYAENAYLCDASTPSCDNEQVVTNNVFTEHGTSYAAPRVAGFAALVRGKFPNLGGAQTAKILLDTATTAGLACHTGNARKSIGCAKNIYGQGRVDITTALSPIGNLK